MIKNILRRMIVLILGLIAILWGIYFIFSAGATPTANIFDAIGAIIIGLSLIITALFFEKS